MGAEHLNSALGIPGPGRPKGSKTKPKDHKAIARKMASKMADEMMDAMLGKSSKIVEEALDATRTVGDGENAKEVPDLQTRRETARFVLSRFAPPSKAKTFIENKLSATLDSFADVENVSQEAIILAMDGLMSMEQVAHLQTLLQNHAAISGYMKIEELREELSRLANARTIDGQSREIPAVSELLWGGGADGKGPNSKGNSPDRPAE